MMSGTRPAPQRLHGTQAPCIPLATYCLRINPRTSKLGGLTAVLVQLWPECFKGLQVINKSCLMRQWCRAGVQMPTAPLESHNPGKGNPATRYSADRLAMKPLHCSQSQDSANCSSRAGRRHLSQRSAQGLNGSSSNSSDVCLGKCLASALKGILGGRSQLPTLLHLAPSPPCALTLFHAFWLSAPRVTGEEKRILPSLFSGIVRSLWATSFCQTMVVFATRVWEMSMYAFLLLSGFSM